ncbi:MAG: YecA family protein [Aureliella sp.]
MTIDNYAPCPCGSGKKMKFCKCVEHPQDYEKIVRLIEGGQELAALDRVNQLLAKTPNAAWLLAMKGELALSLSEHETFKDTAVRFLKLKPDNPLALVMRSLVGLVEDEPIVNVARMILDGLAESRHGLPQLALNAIELMCERLRYSPEANLRFFWSRLLNELSQAAGQQRPSEESLPTDNLLSMCPPILIPTPAGAAWTERANEVASLKSSFRYAQAETKLRSILRDYPDQPGPLSQLLQVQLVLLDQEGATATARKLSMLRELPEVQRDYFAAMALDIEREQPGLEPKMLAKYFEIGSEESAREALGKLDLVRAAADEQSLEMRHTLAATLKDEVPAKTLYTILVTKTSSDGTSYRTSGGSLALLGRQTDKPPRAFIMMFDSAGAEAIFDQLVAAVGVVSELEDPGAPRTFHYLHALDRNRARFRVEENDNATYLTFSEVGRAIGEEFLNIPFPALGGLTPLQAVEEEPKRAMVRAVVTHLEGAHHLVLDLATIDGIYEKLQLTRPVAELEDEQGKLKITTFLELARADVTKLSDSQLMRLLATCLSMNIENVSYRASKELLKRPRSSEVEPMRAPALNVMSYFSDSVDETLTLLEELEQVLVAQHQSAGEVIMRRFTLLNSQGRQEEASEMLRSSFQKYPNDPYLLSLMRYIMQQSQRGPGEPTVNDFELMSRMQRRHEAEPEPESSLVLPGQAAPGEAGKSKLWLPGS